MTTVRQATETTDRQATRGTEPAPSPDRALIDAVEGGLTEGDDRLVEYVGGRPFEVLSDGRRVPLDD